MSSCILRVDSVCVKINGKEILRDFSMKINEGDQWVIYGEAGAGKTVFAHTLIGNYAFRGSIWFPGSDQLNHVDEIILVEQEHRFRNLQNQSNFYYQQRYNSIDAEATITVEDYLLQLRESTYRKFSKAELLQLFWTIRYVKRTPYSIVKWGEQKIANTEGNT